jgi:oligopeptidase A
MAKNGATAFGFERKLTQEYQPFFEREVAALKAWVQQEYPSAAALEPWDLTYYVEKRRKALYDFDDETLRPYYPLPQVMEGMFELAQRLFGIRIEKIQGLPVWHPQVEVYNLLGPQGDLLARFYTDFFPRESKEGGAWMNFFITGNRDGSSEPHLGTMIANLTPPIGDEPALLLHGEVETIFHEFGHLLHHLLSSVEVRSLAGVNVALDFVELPSQIMENWCWERESLNLYARHHQSGHIIPDDLFQRMTGARSYWAANRTMRQLSFGTLDLSIHTQYGPHQGDLVEYSRQVMQGFISTPLPPDFAFVASFTHLFGAPVGYGASYYSYLWSEVLEADAFSRFKQEGIFNAHTGADFAQHILSKGNSVDPAELFRRFMGRDPKPEALLRRSGLLD